MTALLRIDSSISGAASASRVLTDAFAAAWSGTIVHRDLGAHPIPHLPVSSLHWPDEQHPAEAASLQDELIAEVEAADVLLVAAPLYNYSLPSTLKAWLDYLHVPGRTNPQGTQPLAGRQVVVVSTRGAVYDDDDLDFGLPVLRKVLGEHLGMPLRVVSADGTLGDTRVGLEVLAERAAAQRASALAQLEHFAVELS